jgi:hypothetical protein
MTKQSAERDNSVSDSCNIQSHHDHQHGLNCGCKTIKHNDHIDYVHDGHLHRIHGNHVDECRGPQGNLKTIGSKQ